MTTKNPSLRRRLTTTVLLAGVSLGAGVGAAGIASAATGSTTTTNPSINAPAHDGTAPHGHPFGPPPAGAPDPATMTHGPGETLLTGTDLDKATAAAEASQSGATVVRAETESSGTSPYEVHMKKADGTFVTVHLDSSFTVTSTTDGFGRPPSDGKHPMGPPPTDGKHPMGPPPADGKHPAGPPPGQQPPANGQASPSTSH